VVFDGGLYKAFAGLLTVPSGQGHPCWLSWFKSKSLHVACNTIKQRVMAGSLQKRCSKSQTTESGSNTAFHIDMQQLRT
jgi:hypothetical protein